MIKNTEDTYSHDSLFQESAEISYMIDKKRDILLFLLTPEF